MYSFKGYTDKDFETSKLSAGACISLFIWALAIALGLFIG